MLLNNSGGEDEIIKNVIKVLGAVFMGLIVIAIVAGMMLMVK
jgi:hypothetical protein